MQLTTLVKLKTTPEQHAALMQTPRVCNDACDRISKVALESRTFRKYDLHHRTYHNVKVETKPDVTQAWNYKPNIANMPSSRAGCRASRGWEWKKLHISLPKRSSFLGAQSRDRWR